MLSTDVLGCSANMTKVISVSHFMKSYLRDFQKPPTNSKNSKDFQIFPEICRPKHQK